jgi:hypothetical protein
MGGKGDGLAKMQDGQRRTAGKEAWWVEGLDMPRGKRSHARAEVWPSGKASPEEGGVAERERHGTAELRPVGMRRGNAVGVGWQ